MGVSESRVGDADGAAVLGDGRGRMETSMIINSLIVPAVFFLAQAVLVLFIALDAGERGARGDSGIRCAALAAGEGRGT